MLNTHVQDIRTLHRTHATTTLVVGPGRLYAGHTDLASRLDVAVSARHDTTPDLTCLVNTHTHYTHGHLLSDVHACHGYLARLVYIPFSFTTYWLVYGSRFSCYTSWFTPQFPPTLLGHTRSRWFTVPCYRFGSFGPRTHILFGLLPVLVGSCATTHYTHAPPHRFTHPADGSHPLRLRLPLVGWTPFARFLTHGFLGFIHHISRGLPHVCGFAATRCHQTDVCMFTFYTFPAVHGPARLPAVTVLAHDLCSPRHCCLVHTAVLVPRFAGYTRFTFSFTYTGRIAFHILDTFLRFRTRSFAPVGPGYARFHHLVCTTRRHSFLPVHIYTLRFAPRSACGRLPFPRLYARSVHWTLVRFTPFRFSRGFGYTVLVLVPGYRFLPCSLHITLPVYGLYRPWTRSSHTRTHSLDITYAATFVTSLYVHGFLFWVLIHGSRLPRLRSAAFLVKNWFACLRERYTLFTILPFSFLDA